MIERNISIFFVEGALAMRDASGKDSIRIGEFKETAGITLFLNQRARL